MTEQLAREGERPVPDPGKVARAKAVRRGYRVEPDQCRRYVPLKLTDEQVLECRRRYEFEEGWTPSKLAAEFGTSAKYMTALLAYRTRSKLIPPR